MTMLPFAAEAGVQPQPLFDWNVTLRGRTTGQRKAPAVNATMAKAAACCQSIRRRVEPFRVWRNGVVFAVGKGARATYAAPMSDAPSRPFRHHHRVTYAECTVGNHIYYARYLDLLEAARGELFRTAGVPLLKLQEAGTIFPVIECHLEYKAPARYDDELVIEVRLTELGRVRLDFAYRVLRGETLLLTGSTRHVCTALEEKPKRLPTEIAAALSPYTMAAAGEGDSSPCGKGG